MTNSVLFVMSVWCLSRAPRTPVWIRGLGTLCLSLLLASSAFAGPVASVNPTSLDFGQQQVGSTSAPQSITITNSGDEDLTVGVGISQAGSPGFQTSADS